MDGWKKFNHTFKIQYKRRGLPGLWDRIKTFFTGRPYFAAEFLEVRFLYQGDVGEPCDVFFSGLYIITSEIVDKKPLDTGENLI